MTTTALQRRIRLLLWVFIIGLVLSGATALPLEAEVKLLTRAAAGPARSEWEGIRVISSMLSSWSPCNVAR